MAGSLPMDTPIDQMGLSQEEVAQLTPAAKKLTKADLMKMGGWNDEEDAVQGYGVMMGSTALPSLAPQMGLGATDIKSIQTGFGGMTGRVTGGGSPVADNNCCCCPCCTASVELEPARPLD